MSKHTPGPWTFGEGQQWGDTRFYISQQDGAPYTPDYSDVATLIAETISGERVAIQQANARLIAAAPTLLMALEFLLDQAESFNVSGVYFNQFRENRDALDTAHDAIAKATGIQP